MSEFSDREEEKDDFWNIEKLLPKKRSSLGTFRTSSPITTYEVPGETVVSTGERSEEERKLSFANVKSAEKQEGQLTYEPTEAGLIKRVTVRKNIDRYDFYDSFRKAALIYFDYKTPKCDFAEFYSYMPQYSQLSQSQKNYYFYWRSEMRRGKYIKTDYSYVYLYVYEILNLPDKIPAEKGIELLCNVWREYRAALPRIDLYFSIWVQDYCLVHRLPAPVELISDFVHEAISSTSMKEFYLSDISKVGIRGVGAMLAYLSDYDWRRGKFILGVPSKSENEGKITAVITHESYKAHMERAMYLLLSAVWEKRIKGSEVKTTLVKRDAFPNSLCTHSVKSRLEIEYVSIESLEEVRQEITSAVRYTENKLRALMGIKARLAVKNLPDEYRYIIDKYFESLFEKEREIQRKASIPEYEKLYEAPSEDLSFSGADEIELASWDTTARLVEADNGVAEEPVATVDNTEAEVLQMEQITSASSVDTYGLSVECIDYIRYILYGNSDKNYGRVETENFADRINEAFSDFFGDVILESDGENYTIIEDYKEDVIEWLQKITK